MAWLPKSVLLLFLSLPAFIVNAQNLVPNGSFEDITQCPYNFNQVYSALGWKNCGDTPDYFNSCGQPGIIGVPSNAFGYQPAATGNEYAGLWTYTTAGFYREFIGTYLSQPLTTGNTYFVSFKCATGSPAASYCIHTDKIGVRFSSVPYDSITPPTVSNFAHLFTNDVVSDTSNWTTVSGFVTADSNYTFITIGNFFEDANTNTLNPYNNAAAYYYVDDVEVTETAMAIDYVVSANDLCSVYQQGSKVIIDSSADYIESITMHEYTGKLVLSRIGINAKTVHIEVPNQSSGIYFVIIKTKTRYETKKCLILKP